jgi:hypothetical protein
MDDRKLISSRAMMSLILIGALAAAACSTDKLPVPPSGTGVVNVIQAAPGVGPVNVLLDSVKDAGDVPYLGDTALVATTGLHVIAIARAGSSTPSLSGHVTVSRNVGYDFIAAGPGPDSMQLVANQNAVTFDLADSAAVRIYNVVADTAAAFATGSLDIYLIDSAHSLTSPNRAYAGVATYAVALVNNAPVYDDVSPGTYRVVLTAPGDTTTIAADSTITLTAGQVRTIVAAPTADRSAAQLIVVHDLH